MKIKHFAGYGSVNAKKVSCTKNELVVHVWGCHECGVVREDFYDVFNWLVKRFDKTRKDYFEIEDVNIDNWYETEKDGRYRGCDAEHCIYTIRFRERFGR